MKLPNRATLMATAVLVAGGIPEAAAAKEPGKVPTTHSVVSLAKLAMRFYHGYPVPNANFFDRSKTSIFFDVDNKDGSTTEVAVWSTRAAATPDKGILPDPSHAYQVDVLRYPAGTDSTGAGVMPSRELSVSRKYGVSSAEQGIQDPAQPNVLHTTNAFLGRGQGILTYDVSLASDSYYDTHAEGLTVSNDTYQAGASAAAHLYASFDRQVLANLAELRQQAVNP